MAKNTKSHVSGTAVIVGAAGVAAAAIGAYWLYGAEHAEKHRKMAKSWMLKARAEIMDSVQKLKTIDKTAYLAIVDRIMQKYAKMSKDNADIATMTKEMKAAWSHIHAATQPVKHMTKKAVKKIASAVKK